MQIVVTVNSHTKGKVPELLTKRLLAKAGQFFTKKKQKGEVGVIFVGDKEMTRLNNDYRGKNKTTNVLSFCAQEESKRQKRKGDLGDIFICLPEAKREAKKYGLSKEQELARLLIHGFLHLLGYDHMNNREAKKMEALEKSVMKYFKRVQLKIKSVKCKIIV